MTTTTKKSGNNGSAGAAAAHPAAASAVNKALHQFLRAPSVSNKVATLVALKALFAEIDSRRC